MASSVTCKYRNLSDGKEHAAFFLLGEEGQTADEFLKWMHWEDKFKILEWNPVLKPNLFEEAAATVLSKAFTTPTTIDKVIGELDLNLPADPSALRDRAHVAASPRYGVPFDAFEGWEVEYHEALKDSGDLAPRYKHDCKDCRFLGYFGEEDLYFCQQSITHTPTVLARHGDGGSYVSGLSFADTVPELVEAKRRAEAAGLLPRG